MTASLLAETLGGPNAAAMHLPTFEKVKASKPRLISPDHPSSHRDLGYQARSVHSPKNEFVSRASGTTARRWPNPGIDPTHPMVLPLGNGAFRSDETSAGCSLRDTNPGRHPDGGQAKSLKEMFRPP